MYIGDRLVIQFTKCNTIYTVALLWQAQGQKVLVMIPEVILYPVVDVLV